jgi:hypothetical protein
VPDAPDAPDAPDVAGVPDAPDVGVLRGSASPLWLCPESCVSGAMPAVHVLVSIVTVRLGKPAEKVTVTAPEEPACANTKTFARASGWSVPLTRDVQLASSRLTWMLPPLGVAVQLSAP